MVFKYDYEILEYIAPKYVFGKRFKVSMYMHYFISYFVNRIGTYDLIFPLIISYF